MKRTPITPDLAHIPTVFHPLLVGSRVYDSSCSPEARVLYIEREGGLFLKSAPRGTLEKEAQMARYFHKKGLGAPVLTYLSEERDWLLTARVRGEDATDARYLAEPARLAETMGEMLRALHEEDFSDCPVKARMNDYFATVAENYRKGSFDLSFAGFVTAEEAYRRATAGAPYLQNDTLVHGDFCLPNFLMENWRFTGYIDLGNGGVGDRHVDLFWGAWTLNFNLHTDRYRDRFFDAYGRDRIEEEALLTVAAAEVFG